MAARAYWSGQIRLALVSITVQVFSATKSAPRIAFNQIHQPSGKRIRYEKVVPGIGAVDATDIVKGYEVEKGRYVLLTDDEIDNVKLEAKRTIDLVQFVDEDEIESAYFEKALYVAPDGDEVAGEAYVVLREALKQTGKVGLGQLVVRGHSTLVALRARGKGLVIETLHYADEVQKPDAFYADIPEARPEPELLSLAEELIARKSKPFDPKAFKDPYEVALRELIDAKLEDRPPEEIDAPEMGAKVINLMEALKRSVGEGANATAKGKAASGGPADVEPIRPVRSASGKAAVRKGSNDADAEAPVKRAARSAAVPTRAGKVAGEAAERPAGGTPKTGGKAAAKAKGAAAPNANGAAAPNARAKESEAKKPPKGAGGKDAAKPARRRAA